MTTPITCPICGTPIVTFYRMKGDVEVNTNNDWISVKTMLPKQGQVVMTKIDDADGCRNVTTLKLMHGRWFFDDGSMYVYYCPTHWKETLR